jgi:hypothetical protein
VDLLDAVSDPDVQLGRLLSYRGHQNAIASQESLEIGFAFGLDLPLDSRTGGSSSFVFKYGQGNLLAYA